MEDKTYVLLTSNEEELACKINNVKINSNLKTILHRSHSYEIVVKM